MPNNIVTFGLKNACYSLIKNENGNISYSKSKKILYAQEMSIDLKGGTTNTYADDITCATFNLIAGYTLNLKLTELSDEFKIDVLRYKYNKNNNLVETNNTIPVPFAVGYEMAGDVKNRRIWHLFCIASPTSFATKSKTDSVEANSITLVINTYNLILKKYEVSKVICSEGDSNYNSFLDVPPDLRITTKQVNLFDFSTSENDEFIDVEGYLSSINGYSYNGNLKTKGLKLNSNQYLIIHTNLGAKEVIIKIVGYCNSNTASTRVLVEDLDELTNFYTEGEFANKNIKEITSITFQAVAGHTYKLRKGDYESMIVLIEKIEVFLE
ncbi:MAG: hypothetical protein K2N64_05255 [Anaeroplasmataceae bacterium]|nr:hypothetical protein [Anaeroplasmataceae bacterium]